MGKSSPREFIGEFTRWASAREDVSGVILVGSHARGEAAPDSDIDLVVLTSMPEFYLSCTSWTSIFGDIHSCSVEDWGEVQSVRVFYRSGLEVEAGITLPSWLGPPIPATTLRVLQRGMQLLFHRKDDMLSLLEPFSR